MENQNRGRRLLILGNGFDLAHELPTRYTDFLDFCRIVVSYVRDEPLPPEEMQMLPERISSLKGIASFKQIVQKAFDRDDKILKKIKKRIGNNIWYKFFDKIRNGNGVGPNWIDFEKEIRNVIEFADRKDINLDEPSLLLLANYNQPPSVRGVEEIYDNNTKLKLFGYYTEDFVKKSNENDNYILTKVTLRDLRKYWYQHLEKFIEALNIYFA